MGTCGHVLVRLCFQYLPCDEVLEAEELVVVLWVLLNVLVGKESLTEEGFKTNLRSDDHTLHLLGHFVNELFHLHVQYLSTPMSHRSLGY